MFLKVASLYYLENKASQFGNLAESDIKNV